MRRGIASLAFLGLALGTLLSTSGPVQAVGLYGCGHDGSNGLSTLYRLPVFGGTATAIGPIGFERVGAMDAHPLTQVLYACGERPGTSVPVLIRIDVATGAGTEIGPTGIAGAISDIAFRPSDGVLFAHDATPGAHQLYTINIATGAATLVGPTGVGGQGNGLEFRFNGDLLLITDVNRFRLNQTTGLATNVGGLTYMPAATGNPRVSGADQSIEDFRMAVLVKDYDLAGNTHYGFLNTNGLIEMFGDTGVPALDGLAFVGHPMGYATSSSTGGGPSSFYRIDLVSGTPTLLGPIGFNGVGALVSRPSFHVLYGTGARPGSGVPVLLTIDPKTGKGTEIGPTGISANISDLAFNGSTTLYGYSPVNDPDHSLYTFDLSTGAATLVGNTGLGFSGGNGIALMPDGNILYHANRAELHTLNLVNGSSTLVTGTTYQPPLNTPSSRPAALDFNWNATLFGLVKQSPDAFRTSLATLDLRTGTFRQVADTGIESLDGLAVRTDLSLDARVTSPNGGENLVGLTNHLITWDSMNDPTVTSVDIWLSDGVKILASTGGLGPSDLYEINPTTGAATLIGPIGFSRVGAMVMNPRNPEFLYACAQRTGDGTPVLIGIFGGSGQEIGPTGIAGAISDLSFRPSDNTLFAYDASGHQVYTLNIETGKGTLVGPSGTGFNGGNGIAFSSGNVLYHVNRTNLSTLDQTTGLATPIHPMTYPAPLTAAARASAMEFNPGSGQLVAIIKDAGATYLGTIDINTGNVTVIGNTGQAGLDGMAFVTKDLTNIAFNEPNDGSYNWHVPNTPTNLARVLVVMRDGLFSGEDFSDGFFTIQDLTGVSDPKLGQGTYLSTLSPNPFGSDTQVQFALARPATVRLTVHDVRGRLARTLVDGMRPAGEQTVRWDGRNQRGTALPSGVYVVRLEVDGKSMTRLATLLR